MPPGAGRAGAPRAPMTQSGRPDADATPPGVPTISRGALATVWFTLFLDLVGFGIIIPVLPYYAESFGATPKVVTLLSTAFSLAQFVCAPLLGRLSDRHGRRPVMLVSIAGSCAASLVLASAGALWLVFAARALGGASNANIATAHAYVADSTPPEQRAKYMGLMGSAIGLGFVFGPAIGGLLSVPGHPELPFVVAAGLAAINWVMALFLLPETRRPQAGAGPRRPHVGLFGALRGSLIGTLLGALVLVYFLFSAVFSAMESTFALFCEHQFLWSSREVGYLFTFIGVVIMLTQGVLVGRMVAWLREKKTLVVGLVVLAAGLATTGSATTVWMLTLGAAFIAAGNGLTTTTLSALVSRGTSADEQGWAQGLTQGAAAVARIAGPVGAGILFEVWAPGIPMILGAVTLLALALPVVVMRVRPAGPAPDAGADDG